MDHSTAKTFRDLSGWSCLSKVGRCLHAFTRAFNSCGFWPSTVVLSVFTEGSVLHSRPCAPGSSRGLQHCHWAPLSFSIVYHQLVVRCACVLHVCHDCVLLVGRECSTSSTPGPSYVTRAAEKALIARVGDQFRHFFFHFFVFSNLVLFSLPFRCSAPRLLTGFAPPSVGRSFSILLPCSGSCLK